MPLVLDAPVSWAMDGIRRLAADGHPPAAMAISHRDLAGSGDAFDAFAAEFGVPILMHRADQTEKAPRALDVALRDVMGSPILNEAEIEVIHIPGHSPGSIMLYLPDAGGILLAGDSAVGPGPEQSDRTPRLERTKAIDDEAAFIAQWKDLVRDRPLAAILPLHGEWYLRADLGDAAFDAVVANIWAGDPMDPSKT